MKLSDSLGKSHCYLEISIIELTTYTISPNPTISPGLAEHYMGPLCQYLYQSITIKYYKKPII